MLDLFRQYMPHVHCWNNETGWVITSLLTNVVIALSYFVLSGILLRVSRFVQDTARHAIYMFTAFIFFCGVGHCLEILDLYRGLYRVSAVWSIGTAVVSATAALWVTFFFMRMGSRHRLFALWGQTVGWTVDTIPEAVAAFRAGDTLPSVLVRLLENDERMIYVGDISTVGPSAGKVFAVTPALADALGYKVEEMLGVNAYEYILPADMEDSVKVAGDDYLSTEDFYDNHWVAKDGTPVPLRWRALYHEEGVSVGAWEAVRRADGRG